MPRPFVSAIRGRPVTARANVLAVGTAALVGVLALAGCGTESAQSKEHASTAGVNTSVGDVLIRNASITLVGGSDAVVTMVLYNEGTGTDTLASASSSAAASATLPSSGGPGGGLTAPSPSSDTGSSAAGLELTTGAAVFLNTYGHEIALRNVKTNLIGATVPITLGFSTAGSITLSLPITDLNPALSFVTPAPAQSGVPAGSSTAAVTSPTP